MHLTSATGGEGSAGWGGNCSLAQPAQLAANQGGVTLNAFGAALSVKRHLVITGCSGGVGRGGPGGWAAPAGLEGAAPLLMLMKKKLLMWLVMMSVTVLGASVTVGGNISIAGGDGGAAIGGTGDGGQGALAFVRGFSSSTITAKGTHLQSPQAVGRLLTSAIPHQPTSGRSGQRPGR
jgi:hypothetical protein